MGWKANLAKWEQSEPEQWAQAMAFQILRYNTDGFHRWFDSGDLQSIEMLDAIVQVCRMTPKIKHWLPTQERAIVVAYGELPENLIVRVSASKLDGELPKSAEHGSQVFTKDNAPKGLECKARTRGNACGPCRACWDKTVAFISYPKH
jgi:hypothetical protein